MKTTASDPLWLVKGLTENHLDMVIPYWGLSSTLLRFSK
jgi:hypothetical protein